MKTIKCLFIIIFVFLISAGFAQTNIPGGNIEGNWSNVNSPYYVNGEITIPDGKTLTIEPRVEVIFTGHYKFNIQGQLLAIGSKEDTITFTEKNANIGWNGLRFVQTPPTNDTSKIVYCKLQYAQASGIGGAIYIESFNKLIISNCLITKNKTSGDLSSGGAGIGMVGSSPVIESNMISYNIASGGHGGGLLISDSDPLIRNNIISKNESTAGSAFAVAQGNPVFINNTIVENKADIAGGAPCHGGAMCIIACSPVFFNTIIYGNKAAIGNQAHLQSGSQPAFLFCTIGGGSVDFARDGHNHGSYSGTYVSNIVTDPLFLNLASDDYRLSDNSPCISAGSDSIIISNKKYFAPQYDYEGNLRPSPSGSMPDIGACENLLGTFVGVEEELTTPKEFVLYQNYPNPFNPSTTIKYSIPQQTVGNENFRSVHLIVYDILGRELTTLVNEEKPAGTYEVKWNAADLPSGVYFYQLKVGSFTATKKLLLLK